MTPDCCGGFWRPVILTFDLFNWKLARHSSPGERLYQFWFLYVGLFSSYELVRDRRTDRRTDGRARRVMRPRRRDFYFILRPCGRTENNTLLLLLFLAPASTKPQAWKLTKGVNDCNDWLSCGKVRKNETAFPLCRATDSLWNRKAVSLLSSVITVVSLPISCTSSMVCWLHAPAVSMASSSLLSTFI